MSNFRNAKQKGKKAQAALLSAALLAGAFGGASAFGATNATAQLSPQFHIVVDGEEQTFFTASGKEVHPLVYNGTTYLPLRAIGELMNKNVNWDQTTQTVSLSGTRTTRVSEGTPDNSTDARTVSAQVCPEFTIMVDGEKRSFTDANGNRVYPLLYQGSTYLPLRAIGELMGKSVSWDNATKTATLSGGGGLQVTDADTFTSTPSKAADTNGVISVETAKERALAHAGFSANQVTFTKQALTYDDGRQVYKIEFYTGSAEYEFEINALTGAVLEYDYDGRHGTAPAKVTVIGEDEARELALARVPEPEKAKFIQFKLDRDDDGPKYEGKIYCGEREYEFEIDAVSGLFLDWEEDYRW